MGIWFGMTRTRNEFFVLPIGVHGKFWRALVSALIGLCLMLRVGAHTQEHQRADPESIVSYCKTIAFDCEVDLES